MIEMAVHWMGSNVYSVFLQQCFRVNSITFLLLWQFLLKLLELFSEGEIVETADNKFLPLSRFHLTQVVCNPVYAHKKQNYIKNIKYSLLGEKKTLGRWNCIIQYFISSRLCYIQPIQSKKEN